MMKSLGNPLLCTSRGCRRCEAQGAKLWPFTASTL